MIRLLDLFSGIGGFSLGLERSGGFKTVAFCEIEEYPRRVLAKHWPEVPCYDDVRTLTAARLASDGIEVDAICGGFPCQDISIAGKGAGLSGERSGLWREYARLIGELRPRYVIVENVAALLSRGLGDVLADLASLGYDAEWHCIPASHIGAPHRRDRFWAVAYPCVGEQWDAPSGRRATVSGHAAPTSANDDAMWELERRRIVFDIRRWAIHCAQTYWPIPWQQAARALCGMDDGLSGGLDDERAARVFGNAVVPQIPEMIGRAILAFEGAS